MNLKKLIGALTVVGLVAPGTVLATNGYFSHGYGIKAKGMAGVGIALPQDSLAAATNPAGMVMVGDRLDVGVDWFRPQRETELGAGFGPFAGRYSGNDTENFFIPEFGYNKMLGWNMSAGVSVYGNGGMNTDYKDLNSRTVGLGPPPNGLLGTGKVGVDLIQLFIAPTFAYKVTKDHAIGVSLNLAYQRFAADGLQNFDFPAPFNASASPGNVTNKGGDDSYGWGIRLGWVGQVAPNVTLGATYQTKTRMSKFDKYKGLFAEQGDFDIPENYGIGIAVKATPNLTLAADVQQINYGGIKSIANSLTSPGLLGDANGPGFGWRDMTVYKLGASYEYSKDLTLRAGYSTTRQPIPSDQTFFNILAPGVVENQLTLGATWTLANKAELSVAYMHAFKKTVNGTGPSQDVNLRMYQDSLGVAYGIKFQ
jgi:long-chain fatty acid transport protein